MFQEHVCHIRGISFSPNGRSLISGTDEPSVWIWNLRDGSSKVVHGGTGFLISAAFSPDGLYVAGGNFDGSLWIWDSRRYTPVAKWWGHTDCVRRIEFSPGGKLLMSGSDDGTVKCWDMTLLGSDSEPQSFPEISGHTLRFFLVSLIPHVN